MIDGFGRTIDHLRLSLTDWCNLACGYCVPARSSGAASFMERPFAEAVARWLAEDHGVRHLRLTGGEPLMYPELVPLVESARNIESLQAVTMTTNGQALARHAATLRDAGLTRVNVSLDTLRPDRFRRMCGGEISRTFHGIECAIEIGLHPVKINVVVQRGRNDDEIVALARWGLSRGCIVRFLEVMPVGPTADVARRTLVSAADILDELRTVFDLEAAAGECGQPSVDYTARGDGMCGTIGIIASTTQPFCHRCRRVRITSRGLLVPCLHDDRKYDLNVCWDGASFDRRRGESILNEALGNKPKEGSHEQSLAMVAIGG